MRQKEDMQAKGKGKGLTAAATVIGIVAGFFAITKILQTRR